MRIKRKPRNTFIFNNYGKIIFSAQRIISPYTDDISYLYVCICTTIIVSDYESVDKLVNLPHYLVVLTRGGSPVKPTIKRQSFFVAFKL